MMRQQTVMFLLEGMRRLDILCLSFVAHLIISDFGHQ